MIDLNNEIIRQDMERIYISVVNGFKKLDNSSIYISGAAGMIASYVTAFLIYLNEVRDCHIEIYAGVRNMEKAERKFGFYTEKEYFHVITQDVNDRPDADKYQFDYIIHAASPASPQYYGKSPVETMLPNIVGTYQLLDYSVKQKIRSFLFFSSGSVYGSVKNAASISENTIAELDFLASGNVYAESKRCGEAMCMAYYREYNAPIKIARIHHTYGPTMDPVNDKRVFSEFVGNVLKGQDIVLKSDGKSKRAFCYLTDTVSALLSIMINGDDGECYNVGNNKEYVTVRELAERIVKLFPEKNLNVTYRARTDEGYCLSPENRIIPLNIDKIKGLGWKPAISIEEGFYRTIKYLAEEKVG